MSDSKERAGEVPFPELLRAIPSRHRVAIPFLFAEDGTEIGHHIIPVGVHMHRAADLIEQQAARIEELERDAERLCSLLDATEVNGDRFTWKRRALLPTEALREEVMDAFEKWWVKYVGNNHASLTTREARCLAMAAYSEGKAEGIKEGLRRAADIASAVGQIGQMSAEGTAQVDYMAKKISMAIIKEIGE